MNDNALTTVDYAPVSAKALQQQVNAIQEAMKQVMEKGVHYGTVPGCGPKPTLLKPGAEKICLMFRLAAEFQINKTELGNGHREYEIVCTLRDHTGRAVGQGVGCISTMEKKYRYRKNSKGNQIENPDIADTYNTVLKIGKKRAHVDATLTTTAASDIFTQDIEEVGVADYVDGTREKPSPRRESPPHPADSMPVDTMPAYEDESQDGSGDVAYKIPYDRKDEFKGLLKDHGHRWDTTRKVWAGGDPVGGEIEAFRV